MSNPSHSLPPFLRDPQESGRSTQSEWVTGQKGGGGKKSGLIGKLRKLTRGLSSEREFGSGSDISSASVQSAAVQQQQQRQQQQQQHRTSAAAKVTDD